MSVTATYQVNGMTCGHCVHAVTNEVSAIEGVTAVTVDLKPGAASLVTVTSEAPVSDRDIADAVDEAGYEVAAG